MGINKVVVGDETKLDLTADTATASDVVDGKTFHDKTGELVTGNVEEIKFGITYTKPTVSTFGGASNGVEFEVANGINRLIRKDSSVAIQATNEVIANKIGLTADKLLTGNTILGVVGTAISGTDTTDATAIASDIVKDKTAYVDGEKITGTVRTATDNYWNPLDDVIGKLDNDLGYEAIVSRFGDLIYLGSIPPSNNYYDSDDLLVQYECNSLGEVEPIKLSGTETIGLSVPVSNAYPAVNYEATATANDIVSGKIAYGTSGKITGTAVLGVDTSDATATANDILSGKIAYVNGEKVTGSVNNSINQTYTITGASATKGELPYTDNLYLTAQISSYRMFGNSYIQLYSPYESVASAISLTADTIVAGKTVLGITGTGGGATVKTGTVTPKNRTTVSVTIDSGKDIKFAALFCNTGAILRINSIWLDFTNNTGKYHYAVTNNDYVSIVATLSQWYEYSDTTFTFKCPYSNYGQYTNYNTSYSYQYFIVY